MKTIRLLLILLGICFLAVALPWFYHLMFGRSLRSPFMLYSEIEQCFVRTRVQEQELIRENLNGKRYSEQEFDSILPCFYVRQLALDKRLPDTILGKRVSQKSIRAGNFIFRYSPVRLNTHPPKAYQLLESASGRVNLSPAEDLFVFRGAKILFIDAASQKLNLQKSALFQHVFEREKVAFPLQAVVGDGNARKEYEPGYLLLDAEGELFHMKLVHGKAFLVHISTKELPAPIIGADLCGFTDRSKLAYIYTEDGALYLLKLPGYKMQRVDLPKIDYARDEWMAIGNLFYTTYRIGQGDRLQIVAVHTDTGERVDTYTETYSPSFAERLEAYLFPFSLRFLSQDSTLIYPRFHWGSPWALCVNIIFLAIFVAMRRPSLRQRSTWLQSIIIALSGVYGFICLLLYARDDAARAFQRNKTKN